MALVVVGSSVAQNRQEFVAFGTRPKVVPDQLHKDLKYAKTIDLKLKLLDSVGNLFKRSGNPDSLVYYGTKIKKLALSASLAPETKNKYKLKALVFNGLGLKNMGLLDEAVGNLLNAIALSKNNLALQTACNLVLAETYLLKQQPKKAKTILNDVALHISKTSLSAQYQATTIDYYLYTKQTNKALSWIDNALDSIKKSDKNKLYLQLQLKKGQVFLFKNQSDKALQVFSEIKNEVLSEGYFDVYTAIILNEGRIFTSTKNYVLAEMALSSAYVNAVQWNRLDLQQKIIGALTALYVKKGDYKNAYNLKTQLDAVNQVIRANQNQRLVKDLEIKYETLKKEQEINTLQEDKIIKQAEIKRQKTIKYAILIGFLIVLIPIILLLVVYYQKLQTQSLLSKQQEILSQQEVKSLLQAQELELANTTIAVQNKERDRIARELHDSIGANIAGIKLQLDANNSTNTKPLLDQLDKTYHQVREISHSLIPKEFKEQRFVSLVKHYINNISKNKSVAITFEAYPEKDLNKIDYKLQSTLLNISKELITNAFKHANATEIDLQISLLADDDSIQLIYEDDGQGFDTKTTKNGIGLNNIKHRVSALKGTFSINSRLNKGTVITLSIPQNP